ncbi:MAG: alpha amylase catalytic region, partial [Acidobacteria bacterium]|nr:alpha amylase catalytic region [Acidobacteriota bacterium]
MEFDGRSRVIIEGVQPAVDEGRFPAKRVIGDRVLIEADIFADGHDLISAVMLHRHSTERSATTTRMTALPNDRWRSELIVDRLGFYFFTFEAWIDHFLTWHRDLKKRFDAGQESEIAVQLRIGMKMIRDAATLAKGRDRKRLEHYLETIESDDEIADKVHDLFNPELAELMWRFG